MPTEAEFLLLQSRVRELEDKLQFLYHRLNIDYASANSDSDPVLSHRIQEALRNGNKIEAIKIYRELTGAGLAEAKRAVDAMATKVRF